MAQNQFEKVEMTRPQRSMFDLSHDVKGSYNFGKLYPVMVRSCMPGDRFFIQHEALIRALPLVAPVMHRINVSLHTFFVPWRLLWDNWGKWMTNTKVGSVLPAHPFINWTGHATPKSLGDYMGLPVNVSGSEDEFVNALQFAAYQFIYNEYYRDQNLIAEVVYKCVDGSNDANADLFVTRTRAWRHDYFTSCLPFAQKGDAVSMPFNFSDVMVKINHADTLPLMFQDPSLWNTGAETTQPKAPGGVPVGLVTAAEALFADTSSLAGSSSINDLRTAEALQKWLERAARGGSRENEWILSMYGVRTSDARLQRPEYVAGSVTPLLISDVMSTAETAAAPQANMAGQGWANVNGRSKGYFCEEFGTMMTIMSIMPETAYQQGIERSNWLRINNPSELPNPLFARLGEQEVKVRELYAFDVTSNDLFGYIPRFAEDRYSSNIVTGEMRSSLDYWHLGRIFANAPALNQQFVECDAEYRVFAVDDPTEDHFVAHVYHKVKALRPLPKYANPSLI